MRCRLNLNGVLWLCGFLAVVTVMGFGLAAMSVRMHSNFIVTTEHSSILKNVAGLRAEVEASVNRLANFTNTVDCEELFAGNEAEFRRAEAWKYSALYDPVWRRVLNTSDQCEALKSEFAFANESFSREEAEFPLAYGILVHKSAAQIVYLLSVIYRPENVYVISVDGKALNKFKDRINLLSDCFPNIYIVHTSNVPWCGYEIVRSVFNAVRLLSSLKHPWRYFQYLSGADLPLKTNLEMVRIFKELNGAFITELTPSDKFRLGNISTAPTLNFFKSSLSATFSREAANFMVKDSEVQRLLDFLKLTKCPDESIWATIAGNPDKIPIPGGFDGRALLSAKIAAAKRLRRSNISVPFAFNRPAQFYFSRYQVWQPHGRCEGKFMQASCVFGVRDLPSLAERPELVAHKIYSDFQPATYFCLWKRQWHRALDLRQQQTFDAQAYGKTALVEAVGGVAVDQLHFYPVSL